MVNTEAAEHPQNHGQSVQITDDSTSTKSSGESNGENRSPTVNVNKIPSKNTMVITSNGRNSDEMPSTSRESTKLPQDTNLDVVADKDGLKWLKFNCCGNPTVIVNNMESTTDENRVENPPKSNVVDSGKVESANERVQRLVNGYFIYF